MESGEHSAAAEENAGADHEEEASHDSKGNAIDLAGDGDEDRAKRLPDQSGGEIVDSHRL